MGRSVSYLSHAIRVAYFEWPKFEILDDDDNVEDYEYQNADEVIEDIQRYIKDLFPDFSICSRYDGREDHIILEGYGTEIGLSEYCGLATLSIRVDESIYDYIQSEEECEQERLKIVKFIEDNWEQMSKPWNEYNKIGTFSNGEAVYEKVKS